MVFLLPSICEFRHLGCFKTVRGSRFASWDTISLFTALFVAQPGCGDDRIRLASGGTLPVTIDPRPIIAKIAKGNGIALRCTWI
jgi:hypothetical protein